MLTQQRLKDVLSYDQDTGIFRWKQATARRITVGDVAGSPHKRGYNTIRIDNILYLAHRLAWLYMNGDWPKSGLDHKDGDEKNNKINNLRLANQSENLFNTKKRKKNASGYKGVHWDKRRQKWMAFITAFKKRKHVGYYLTAEEAFTARCDAALRLHGEFARHS